jgi:hypothetical protein
LQDTLASALLFLQDSLASALIPAKPENLGDFAFENENFLWIFFFVG